MVEKKIKQAEIKIFKKKPKIFNKKSKTEKILENIGLKRKKGVFSTLSSKFKKDGKLYPKVKKIKKRIRKLTKKNTLTKVIIVFATLAMLAGSILPYIL